MERKAMELSGGIHKNLLISRGLTTYKSKEGKYQLDIMQDAATLQNKNNGLYRTQKNQAIIKRMANESLSNKDKKWILKT